MQIPLGTGITVILWPERNYVILKIILIYETFITKT